MGDCDIKNHFLYISNHLYATKLFGQIDILNNLEQLLKNGRKNTKNYPFFEQSIN